MPIIKTTSLARYKLTSEEQLYVYCGLDTCIMFDVLDAIRPHLKPETTGRIYDFERGMLGPAMAMMRRGVYIDDARRQELIKEFTTKYDLLVGLSRKYASVIFENYSEFNPNSGDQLGTYFYQGLGIEPYYSHKAKSRKPSTDEDTLEKIIEGYPIAEPMARCILSLRETKKKLDVLVSGVDPDGRMRCSYHVTGTRTGRWASSQSIHDTGSNLQNITKKMREIFIPDPGYVMFEVDLEQAESRGVAYLSGDEAYMQATSEDDIHTAVAVDVFGVKREDVHEQAPGMPESYRQEAKRNGHSTNYNESPFALGRRNKLHISQSTKFQALYKGAEVPLESAVRWKWVDAGGMVIDPSLKGRVEFDWKKETVRVVGKFPKIAAWQQFVQAEIKEKGRLITPLGRERQFWKRLNDDKTVREAIAYVPQSMIGDILNVGLWRIWRELELCGVSGVEPGDLQILLQVHDSVVGQIRKDKVDKLLPLVLQCLTNPVTVNGRILTIPSSAKVGMNWRPVEKDKKTGKVYNPNGLKEWKHAT